MPAVLLDFYRIVPENRYPIDHNTVLSRPRIIEDSVWSGTYAVSSQYSVGCPIRDDCGPLPKTPEASCGYYVTNARVGGSYWALGYTG
jgi:hypothetical protein